ncbi:hypothetical protein ACPXCE_25780 [Streptomyces sp. DT24]|uniref:hypothetical protein n=1 Tax=Streptomyces sp. DT24 TaxID=3416520 RepID=UPI003CF2AE93
MVTLSAPTVQDHVALAEIELCGDLIIAASTAREERLSPDRIDEVLNVRAETLDAEAEALSAEARALPTGAGTLPHGVRAPSTTAEALPTRAGVPDVRAGALDVRAEGASAERVTVPRQGHRRN